MFKTYTEIIGKYSALFKQYECDLKTVYPGVISRSKVLTADCRFIRVIPAIYPVKFKKKERQYG